MLWANCYAALCTFKVPTVTKQEILFCVVISLRVFVCVYVFLKTSLLYNKPSAHYNSPPPLPVLHAVIYVDGSVLVFDDIFKLIAFYCVSR